MLTHFSRAHVSTAPPRLPRERVLSESVIVLVQHAVAAQVAVRRAVPTWPPSARSPHVCRAHLVRTRHQRVIAGAQVHVRRGGVAVGAALQGGARPQPFNSTPMGDNSISPGSPHVRPMGRACGEPGEIKKNTHPKNITALFGGQAGCKFVQEQLSLASQGKLTVACADWQGGKASPRPVKQNAAGGGVFLGFGGSSTRTEGPHGGVTHRTRRRANVPNLAAAHTVGLRTSVLQCLLTLGPQVERGRGAVHQRVPHVQVGKDDGGRGGRVRVLPRRWHARHEDR